MEKTIEGQLRVDGGRAWTISVVPTITAGGYTAGDLLGGEQTLTNAARWSGGSGILTGISMSAEDDSGDGWGANDVEVIIFKSNPAGTYADNAALSGTNFSDADATLILGSVLLDTVSLLGNVSVSYARNVNIPYVCVGSTNLYAVAINRGAVTPEATDALQFTYHLIRD
jgi:nucleotide-binding universal stress UspA family protein